MYFFGSKPFLLILYVVMYNTCVGFTCPLYSKLLYESLFHILLIYVYQYITYNRAALVHLMIGRENGSFRVAVLANFNLHV